MTRATLRAIAGDVAAIIGAVLFLYGVDQICRPAAFIVAGGALLAIAITSARRG